MDFVEVERAKPVEFFASNARTRPQGLEGEVIPELIRRVGPGNPLRARSRKRIPVAFPKATSKGDVRTR